MHKLIDACVVVSGDQFRAPTDVMFYLENLQFDEETESMSLTEIVHLVWRPSSRKSIIFILYYLYI